MIILFRVLVLIIIWLTTSCAKRESLSNQNLIESFSFPHIESTVNISNDTIYCTVGKYTDVSRLTPIVKISEFASISPERGVYQDFSTTITYRITSQSGIVRKYYVVVNKTNMSSDKTLLDFSFPNTKYVKYDTELGCNFEFYFTEDLSKLVPQIEISPKAMINPQTGVPTDFTNPVTYTITAEDGSQISFIISCTKTLNSEANIMSFKFLTDNSQVVEFEDNNIYVYMPHETNTANMKAEIGISNLSTIIPDPLQVSDYSNPVVFKVTSSDKTVVKEYTVMVKRSPWRQLIKNGNAPFAKVDGHRLVSFNGYIYLLGGWLGDNQNNIPHSADYWTSQVWRSKDGLNWENMGDAPWAPRHGFGCVVYKNKIWVITGDSHRDAWYTEDGKNWTQAIEFLQFGWRYFPYVSVFKDQMWLYGGKNGWWNNYTTYNDAWQSEDGVNWIRMAENTNFAPRSLISGSVVLNDKLYVIGGGMVGETERMTEYNDVWVSENGVNFKNVIREAPFKPIYWHSVGTYNGKMYVAAGMQRGDMHTNQLWYSSDGVQWDQQKYTFWAPRHATAIVEHEGKLFMIGGTIDPTTKRDTPNDVWVMDGDF